MILAMLKANLFKAPVFVSDGMSRASDALLPSFLNTASLPGIILNINLKGSASNPALAAPPANAAILAARGSILFPLSSVNWDISP